MANVTLNSTNATAVESSPDFFLVTIENLTGGLWGELLIAALFGITFLSLSTYNPREAFAAASVLSLVATILLAPFGVTGTFALTLTGVATALAVIMNHGGVN